MIDQRMLTSIASKIIQTKALVASRARGVRASASRPSISTFDSNRYGLGLSAVLNFSGSVGGPVSGLLGLSGSELAIVTVCPPKDATHNRPTS